MIENFSSPFDDGMIDKALVLIRGALTDGNLALGPIARSFEERFADSVGAVGAVATSSGTSALVAACRALQTSWQSGGTEVILPANTFIAVPAAVTLAGLQPRLVDVEASTLSPSVNQVRNAICEKTAGIVIVHSGGIIGPDIVKIRKLADARGIWLIEDCSHAHGCSWLGSAAGSFGHLGAFSLFSTKVLTSAEGGVVVGEDPVLLDVVRRLVNLGRSGEWGAGHTILGESARMSEIAASLATVNFDSLDRIAAHRRNLAAVYTEALSDRLLRFGPDCCVITPQNSSTHYKYIVLLPSWLSRGELKLEMRRCGVKMAGEIYAESLPAVLDVANIAYLTSHGAGHDVSVDLAARQVCLPIHNKMTVDDAHFVARQLLSVLEQLSTERRMSGQAGEE